ncbi:MAG: hypothetical protein VX555_01185 [Pseudomonadota bacterium]|nr:hypothetical protein [Pseudomonadota bacterium]
MARRKKHSTLTAGVYYPKPEAFTRDYWGVVVDEKPYLLFIADEEAVARLKAEALARSPNFRTLLEATSTRCERIVAGFFRGRAIDWEDKHTVIGASRSGDIETGTRDIAEIKAILMQGSHRAIAETLCIDNTLATLIDATFPQVSDFEELPELSDRDIQMTLGDLESRKHPKGGH